VSYTVYKHTSPSGKVYIGITKRRPSKRYDSGRGYSHCPHMKAAITKYGWANFTHEILADGLTQLEAEIEEVSYIGAYHSNLPEYGYNVTSGGEHATEMTDAGRQRLQERMLGDNNPSRKYGSPMLGKKHTNESKAKMSKSASKRHTPMTEQTRLAIRAGHAFEMKPVVCVETGKVFGGIHEAAEVLGLKATRICAVCKGRRKTTGGYHWRYATPEEADEAER